MVRAGEVSRPFTPGDPGLRAMTHGPLAGTRVLAALNGLELFGHERANIEVLKALRAQGAQVFAGVQAEDAGGDVGAALEAAELDTFPVPFSNQWSIKWLKRHGISALWDKARAVIACNRRFRAAIANYRPTHVYLASSLAYSYVSLALAASDVPLIVRMGDTPPTDSPFNMRIWRRFVARATRIVAISKFIKMAAQAQGARPDRVSVIYSRAPSRHGGDAAEGSLPASSTRQPGSIVYVGNFTEQKGLRELIRACAILSPRFPRLTVTLVGGSRYDSEYRGEVYRLIEDLRLSDRIRLVGYVADTRPFYREAAVHVAPSLWNEAFGNVLLEAKEAGVPSVIFDDGGLAEGVRHRIDGFICGEKTAQALASGLAWFLEDQERLRVAGEAAREDYLRRFGPERFAREWTAVFASAPEAQEVLQS